MAKDKNYTNTIIIVSFISIVFFGIFGKVAEMGVMTTFTFIILFFLNIDKFKSIKAGSLEAELEDAVKEAYATIEQLKEISSSSAKASISTIINSYSLNTENDIVIHDELIVNLKNIGVSQTKIEEIDKNWPEYLKEIESVKQTV